MKTLKLKNVPTGEQYALAHDFWQRPHVKVENKNYSEKALEVEVILL